MGDYYSSMNVIEPAKSGRAKCRRCKKPIPKGEDRFGWATHNSFDPDESTYEHWWYHLSCAVKKHPEGLRRSSIGAERKFQSQGDLRTPR